MKEKLFGVMRSRGVRVVVAATASSLAVVQSAHAELPAWISTLATDVSDGVDSMGMLFGPIVGVVLLSMICIKLAKRYGNKI